MTTLSLSLITTIAVTAVQGIKKENKGQINVFVKIKAWYL